MLGLISVLATASLTIAKESSAQALPSLSSSPALFVVQSPRSAIEDFGSGSTVNGHTEVRLDPQISAAIGDHSYYVFLTAEADSHGLYVSRKTTGSFEVREQEGGVGNTPFDYRIVVPYSGSSGGRAMLLDPVPTPDNPKDLQAPVDHLPHTVPDQIQPPPPQQ
jgi:hypothetical protein